MTDKHGILFKKHAEKKYPTEKYNTNYFSNYSDWIKLEYKQSIEEGLNLADYKDVFESVAELKGGHEKDMLCEALFDIVLNAKKVSDFKYNEPNELSEIRKLAKPYPIELKFDEKSYKSKIAGAWHGRVAGCYLGKPIEPIERKKLEYLLKASDNFPLSRYISSKDITEEIKSNLNFDFLCPLSDEISFAPSDDDTNYTVIAQYCIDCFGKSFTSDQLIYLWQELQGPGRYASAEQIAYRNAIGGLYPPATAIYKNPFREWIGAQIRADYYGYICPGDPKTASELAYRDASISHTKNGIYGAMWIAAMNSIAATTRNMKQVILGGLSQIPSTSRLFENVTEVIKMYDDGKSYSEVFDRIHTVYKEKDEHDGAHVLPNAMIVATALLYGQDDFSKSLCLAVEPCFDPDCNGATVGSIAGMAYGFDAIDEKWYKLFNDTLQTSLYFFFKNGSTFKISELIEKTVTHVNLK